MITGYFKSISVPEVAAGEDVKATIDFYALNPGAFYWKTFLIVDSPGLSLRKLLDAARETGQEGGREKTYTLGKMPDKDAAISFFLFAHDDAGYDWDWGEYNDWMIGFATRVTHLASEYKLSSPGEVPPEPPPDGDDARLSGLITEVTPAEIPAGRPLDLYVSFNAYADTAWEQIKGWDTRVTATLDGLSKSDIQYHTGKDGSRTGQSLHLGTMPGRDLSGRVLLEGRGKNLLGLPADWQELDRKGISITVSTGPAPPDEDIFSGHISGINPSTIRVGDILNLRVSFTARTTSGFEALNGWFTKLVLELDGISKDQTQLQHFGYEYQKDDELVRLGTMPGRNLSGTVKLYGFKGGFSTDIELIDTKNIAITASTGPAPPDGDGQPVPPTCSIDADCPEGYKCQDGECVKKEWWESEWLVPAAIVGIALLLLPGKRAKKEK